MEMFSKKALKNTICVEWPDYLVKNKNIVLRDEKNVMTLRAERDLSKEQPQKRVEKTINTNYKFGLSKDTPFENKYTELSSLTKAILNREKEFSEERKNVLHPMAAL